MFSREICLMMKSKYNINNGLEPENMGFIQYLFQDAVGVYKKASPIACLLRCIYLPTFRRIVKFRCVQYLKLRNRLPLLTRWLLFRYNIKNAKYGIYLPYSSQIGPGFRFVHAGPLLIHDTAILGKNCIVHPCAQIGTTRTKEGGPIIGDNCFIGNGCHIIGNCKIGNWCFISPGAFVCKDIPEGSVVGFGLNNIISNKGKEIVSMYL